MEVVEVRSPNASQVGSQSPTGQGGGGGYRLTPTGILNEDILFCIDVGPETMMEMKVNGPNGRPFTRLESIKQAILLFVHSKLSINSDHRFLFCALGKSTYWIRKEFSSEVDSVSTALQGLSVESTPSQADLTQLFKVATHTAKKSRLENRIFRLIFIYCRSSMKPQYQLPPNLKLFTLDVMYLHDKPGPNNCPQIVYDALVDALEQISEFEGYIFESGQGLTRALFRDMCKLLCHPQQRCIQDEFDLPKPLIKKPSAADSSSQGEENAIVIT